MLILATRRPLSAGCNSSSVIAKSPSTTALSSLPANAAQVFTPISLSILTPCIFAGRIERRNGEVHNWPACENAWGQDRQGDGGEHLGRIRRQRRQRGGRWRFRSDGR